MATPRFREEVSPEILRECLNIALQAPTGSSDKTGTWSRLTETSAVKLELSTRSLDKDGYRRLPQRLHETEKGDQASWLNMMAQLATSLKLSGYQIFVPCISGRLGADAMTQAVKWGRSSRQRGVSCLRLEIVGLAPVGQRFIFMKRTRDILGIPCASTNRL